MELDVETLGGAAIWLVMMTLAGFAFFRAKTGSQAVPLSRHRALG